MLPSRVEREKERTTHTLTRSLVRFCTKEGESDPSFLPPTGRDKETRARRGQRNFCPTMRDSSPHH